MQHEEKWAGCRAPEAGLLHGRVLDNCSHAVLLLLLLPPLLLLLLPPLLLLLLLS
jgi:hypothetical protein